MNADAGRAERIGTMTVMFADLVSSTELRQAVGEEDADRLFGDLEKFLIRIVEEHRGRIVKTLGDGVMAAFEAATDALSAAVAIQRTTLLPGEIAGAEADISFRIGLAAGDVRITVDDCKGMPVVEAARLEAAAQAGQILCSELVRMLVRDRGGHHFESIPAMSLKGIQQSVEVSIVRWQDAGEESGSVLADAAVDRSDDAGLAGNLPGELRDLVGRELDVEAAATLLSEHRLVTMTGPGGVGKTRLAFAVAFAVADQFADGVWVAELSEVTSSDGVAALIASTLGASPASDMTVAEAIADRIGDRRILLVLDNCEHLVDVAAGLAEALLMSNNELKILATSREALRVGPERVWAVHPLDTDDGLESSAVRLFVERTQAVDPGFALTEAADRRAAVEICERLDGIPLAIELAAARMASMTAEEIRDRLDSRFRLLTGAGRGSERHQTLHQVVQWSYDLLTTSERDLLLRCSVFSNGFDLDGATAVSGVEGGLDEFAVLDLLDSLVKKSLLRVDRINGRTRYAMLETTRQFVQQEVSGTEECDVARDQHARHFAAQSYLYWDVWAGPAQRDALIWVESEFANLRRGYEWATLRGDVAVAATIASHTAVMAWQLERYEPVLWAEELLVVAGVVDVAHLPRVLVAASLCQYIRRPEEAVRHVERASVLGADFNYEPFDSGIPEILEASAHLLCGRVERWLEICGELADGEGSARVLGQAGLIWMLRAVDEHEKARGMADATLSLAIEQGHPTGISFAQFAHAHAHADVDPRRALETLRVGLQYARGQRLEFWEALITRELAALEAAHGEVERALATFDTSIDNYRRGGKVTNGAFTLAYLAVLFNRIGRAETAATLIGAATHHVDIGWVVDLPSTVERLESELNETTFAAAVAKGAAMEFGQAAHYARQQISAALTEGAVARG